MSPDRSYDLNSMIKVPSINGTFVVSSPDRFLTIDSQVRLIFEQLSVTGERNVTEGNIQPGFRNIDIAESNFLASGLTINDAFVQNIKVNGTLDLSDATVFFNETSIHFFLW